MVTYYCAFCHEVFLPDDLILPAEPGSHGELHLECQELWSEQFYYGDLAAPWERHWQDYLASINGELTTPGGCVIIPAASVGTRPGWSRCERGRRG